MEQWDELLELDKATHSKLWQEYLDPATDPEVVLWKLVRAIERAMKYPAPKPHIPPPMTDEQVAQNQQWAKERQAQLLKKAADNTPAKLAILEQIRRISPEASAHVQACFSLLTLKDLQRELDHAQAAREQAAKVALREQEYYIRGDGSTYTKSPQEQEAEGYDLEEEGYDLDDGYDDGRASR